MPQLLNQILAQIPPLVVASGLLSGCTVATDPAGDSSTTSPWTSAADPDISQPDPQLPPDLKLVQQGVIALCQRVLSADPWLLPEMLDDVLAAGDETCPALTEFQGQVLFEDSCTASNGVSLQGLTLSAQVQQLPLEDGRIAADWFHMTTALTTLWPDGTASRIHADVQLARFDQSPNQTASTQIEVLGRVSSDRKAWAHSWVADAVDQQLYLTTSWQDDLPALDLDLRQSWPGGTPDAAVVEGLSVQASGDGTDCEVSVDLLRLWWPDRGWAELQLEPGLATACQPCGQVWVDGTDIGRTCVDLSALLDWSEQPW